MSAAKPTVANYRNDELYPRIARAVDEILRHGKVVAPVDVFIGMGLLSRKSLEDWRLGRVPFLERVIQCNLGRLGRLLHVLRFHAHDLNLKPSWTAYMRWGKGPKQRLRFTKTGDEKLEEVYATHFVWPGKMAFHERAAGRAEEATGAAVERGAAAEGSASPEGGAAAEGELSKRPAGHRRLPER
ncbi:MAG: hypothetical protein IPK82_34855 [Polyangiaceae bacterium]|nr:hypothetical protein [Polyangiaceae bacterium]